jgi:hypothetical protein
MRHIKFYKIFKESISLEDINDYFINIKDIEGVKLTILKCYISPNMEEWSKKQWEGYVMGYVTSISFNPKTANKELINDELKQTLLILSEDYRYNLIATDWENGIINLSLIEK